MGHCRGGDAGREAGGLRVGRTTALKVWDLERGEELRTLEGHTGWVDGVAVTPDGRRAVSACDDRTLKVWDLETRRGAAHARGAYGLGPRRGGDAGRAAGGLRVL